MKRSSRRPSGVCEKLSTTLWPVTDAFIIVYDGHGALEGSDQLFERVWKAKFDVQREL